MLAVLVLSAATQLRHLSKSASPPRRRRLSAVSRQQWATRRTAPAKNKKVVHLGTIVDDLDQPTWQRKRQGAQETETVTLDKAVQFSPDDDDKYDIPTFLRKQMD